MDSDEIRRRKSRYKKHETYWAIKKTIPSHSLLNLYMMLKMTMIRLALEPYLLLRKSEREDILRHVNLEVNEQNLEWIDNMISGQCLYYDVYGNLNMISVHNLFEDIDMLLKPMKATVSSSLENKYAS